MFFALRNMGLRVSYGGMTLDSKKWHFSLSCQAVLKQNPLVPTYY